MTTESAPHAHTSRQVSSRGLALLATLPASPERDRIERVATANLYKYVAVRLARTGTTRTDGAKVLRYGWQYVRTTPRWWGNLGKISLILGAGALLALFGKKGTGP